VLIEIVASFVSLATTRWMICGWVLQEQAGVVAHDRGGGVQEG
jgi:hypothetical protein